MFENIRRGGRQRLLLLAALLAATALVAEVRAHGRVRGGPATPAALPDRARIEVAFVLDTTGSMSGLIEGAKQKIWSIADDLANARQQTEIRIGLIGYRDRGDAYVTRRHDLTLDLDAIYGHLQAFQAQGGGDTPESVNQALHEAVTQLDWSTGRDVYRVIFLVGDAPPHADYANDVPWTETARLAAQRDIAINTIQCGGLPETKPVWQEIARIGHGQYAAIAQDGAMVALKTPVDDELAELNRALAGTVIAWGDSAQQREIAEKVARSVAALVPSAASRLSYLAKTGGRVNSGRQDLVDAVNEGAVDLKDVPDEELPAELQAMKPEDREAFVTQKMEERGAIRARIDSLTAKRDGYLRAERKRLRTVAGESFDGKVFETIREQAVAKGIVYE